MPLEKQRPINWGLLIALIALLIGCLSLYRMSMPQPPMVALGTTNLDALSLDSTLTVGGASTLTGAVSGGSTGTFAGTIFGTGEIDVGTFLNMSAASTISVTNEVGATGITPLGSYQPLNSAGNVGTIVTTTGFTTGDIVTLVNIGSNTITISDTGVMKLSGNAALGPADTLTIVFHSVQWIELAEGAN